MQVVPAEGIPTPVADPVAGSEKRAVAVQVAPVDKVKKWYRDSGRLERRKSSAKSGCGEDGAGPSSVQEDEDEDEDVEKSTVTTRTLYQRELRDVRKDFGRCIGALLYNN